jgi:Domain of unknown function (DUF4159)
MPESDPHVSCGRSPGRPCAHGAAQGTRRNFLRQVLVGTLASLALARRSRGQAAAPRGAQVGWARLVTPSRYWNTHEDQDGQLADFIRGQTKLNIDPTCYPVPPASVDQLAAFPFIFTNAITPVTDPGQQANLREYLKRGGFFYIDGCVNARVTPSFPVFFQQHADFFAKLFPGSALRMLPEDHAIFRSYFPVDETGTRNGRGPRGHWGNLAEGLYGVYDGDRMISLVSLDHLQCGWPNDPDKVPICMRQIANIYVYAMTR